MRANISCVGGEGGGDALCRDDHAGPLCRVCTALGSSFDASSGSCAACPTGGRPTFWILVGILCGVSFVVAVHLRFCSSAALSPPSPSVQRRLRLARLGLLRLSAAASAFGVRENLKTIVSFFQVAVVIEQTYRARFPPEYLAWLPLWINLDFVNVAIPLECISRYSVRLLLQGLVPLALLASVLAWHVASEVVRRRRHSRSLGGVDVDATRIRHHDVVEKPTRPRIAQRSTLRSGDHCSGSGRRDLIASLTDL